MTTRSKQWYTKTSRLSNSFANNSIGCLLDFVSATKSSARRPVESNRPGWARKKGSKGFQRERNRRFRSLWATARSGDAPEGTTKPNQKFQIFLARFWFYFSQGSGGSSPLIRTRFKRT